MSKKQTKSWAEKMQEFYLEMEELKETWIQSTTRLHRLKVKYKLTPDPRVQLINALVNHYNFCYDSGYINPAKTKDILKNKTELYLIEEKR